jgi:hypothetical protein
MKRLGFWIDERDMWSGIGLNWDPQTFVNNYFLTAPYPSAMIFATGMNPGGPNTTGALGEARWLGQVASLEPNANIIIIFFVNLSGVTIGGQVDQTSQLQQYLSTLGSHPNIVGMEYETEYYGNTAAEEQLFHSIVTGAGYVDIFNPSSVWSYTGEPTLDYSEYPYLNGTIVTNLSPYSLGAGYGETGAPSTGPIWTQAVVTNIVNSSSANPYVFLYCEADTNNPAGGDPINVPGAFLWNSAMLRGWIWNDPNYTSNFILSD